MALTIDGVQVVQIEGLTALGGMLPISVEAGSVHVYPAFTQAANRSGIIAEDSAAQAAIPYGKHRFILFQNISDNPMWINLEGSLAAGPETAGSMYMPPMMSTPFRMENIECAVSVWCAAQGARYTALTDYTGDGG